MSAWIGYARVPGFYAEVERASDPALAHRPVIVGGDPRKGGQVQAATSDARAAGVAEGMPVLEALERCPGARALRTDMRRYREVGARLLACLRRTCERLEEAGLGAAYFAPTDAARRPDEVAVRLRARVRDELALPLRVGVAPVKFLARLAAEVSERDEIQVVGPEELESFLHPLPVTRLDGVGPATGATLAAAGVGTVGELAALGRERLEALLGNRGLELLELARGRDRSPLRASRHSKSLSQESTFPRAQVDRGVLAERLLELAEGLTKRLALEGLAARRVSLKLRYADQQITTRSRTLGEPVARASELQEVALLLLRRTQAGNRPVRTLGLALAELGPERREDRQLELFPRSE